MCKWERVGELTRYKWDIGNLTLLHELLRITSKKDAICSGKPSKVQGLEKIVGFGTGKSRDVFTWNEKIPGV